MADKSKIEWTDASWNPVRGCTKISPGCKHCYAEVFAVRFRGVPGHPYEQGFDLRLVPESLPIPLQWRKPRRIFVNSMSDLFHEDVPREYIAAVFGVMAAAGNHTFQVLTKRADEMRRWFEWLESPEGPSLIQATCRYLDAVGFERGCGSAFEPDDWPIPNVWLGVSVEDRKYGLPRIAHLRETPAAVRFLSIEPLLEDLGELDLTGIHWVIVGGESGRGARPLHPDWARSIRDQCRAAGVPFFFKQWGEWKPVFDRDKEDPDFCRCDAIVRSNPAGRWLNLAGGHGFHGDRVVYVVPAGKKGSGSLLDGQVVQEMPKQFNAAEQNQKGTK